MSDYKINLLFNACKALSFSLGLSGVHKFICCILLLFSDSTSPETLKVPLSCVIDSIYLENESTMLPGNVKASGATVPLSMTTLDYLSVHAKMSLVHAIGMKLMKLSSVAGHPAPSPAIILTYSRLLIYEEIDTIGIKGFISESL